MCNNWIATLAPLDTVNAPSNVLVVIEVSTFRLTRLDQENDVRLQEPQNDFSDQTGESERVFPDGTARMSHQSPCLTGVKLSHLAPVSTGVDTPPTPVSHVALGVGRGRGAFRRTESSGSNRAGA